VWEAFGPAGILDDCYGYHAPAPPPPPGPPITVQYATTLDLNCATTVQAGQTLTVTGTLSPQVNGRSVRITYRTGNPARPLIIDDVTTDPVGRYSDTLAADPAGTWTISSAFAGDQSWKPSTSTGCTTTVTAPPPAPAKRQSSLSLNCTTPVYAHIGTLGVSGGITPERDGVPVTITYTQPDGTTVVQHTATLAGGTFKGSYLDDITPEEPGTWHATASWPGDAIYAGATSRVCSIEVDPEPPK
jgi:hypothetical protein